MSLHVVRHRPNGRQLVCRLCKATYFEDEMRAFERHVLACASRNEHRIHEMSPRTRMPMLTKEGGPDPEREDWVERHAKDILHGRKRM